MATSGLGQEKKDVCCNDSVCVRKRPVSARGRADLYSCRGFRGSAHRMDMVRGRRAGIGLPAPAGPRTTTRCVARVGTGGGVRPRPVAKSWGGSWKTSAPADCCVRALAAEDLRCGGSRLRKGLDILLGDRDSSLVDPLDYQLRFDTAHCVHQLRSAIQKMASEEAAHILDMVLSGFKWEEIASAVGMDGNEHTASALRRRHSRLISRVSFYLRAAQSNCATHEEIDAGTTATVQLPGSGQKSGTNLEL